MYRYGCSRNGATTQNGKFFFFYFLSKIRFLLFIFIRMSKFKNFVKKTKNTKTEIEIFCSCPYVLFGVLCDGDITHFRKDTANKV